MRKNKINKGLSLLEVVIALFIVSIAVLAFSRVAFAQVRASDSNKQRLEALTISENYLEQIRADRDMKRFTDQGTLKIYLENLGFDDNGTMLSKKEKITTVEYNVNIYIDNSNTRLLQLVIEVIPPNSSAIRVGTKLYMDRVVY